MLKVCFLVALVGVLSACQSTGTTVSTSDVNTRRQMIHSLEDQEYVNTTPSSITARRQMIQDLEDQDDQRMRQKRKDLIEDIGEAQMKQAEAINKAHENLSNSNIYIIP